MEVNRADYASLPGARHGRQVPPAGLWPPGVGKAGLPGFERDGSGLKAGGVLYHLFRKDDASVRALDQTIYYQPCPGDERRAAWDIEHKDRYYRQLSPVRRHEMELPVCEEERRFGGAVGHPVRSLRGVAGHLRFNAGNIKIIESRFVMKPYICVNPDFDGTLSAVYRRGRAARDMRMQAGAGSKRSRAELFAHVTVRTSPENARKVIRAVWAREDWEGGLRGDLYRLLSQDPARPDKIYRFRSGAFRHGAKADRYAAARRCVRFSDVPERHVRRGRTICSPALSAFRRQHSGQPHRAEE